MTNNTIPNVPRELLERTIDRLKYGHEHDKALRELRAILATAKSAAADDERMRFDLWAEQQGWPKDHTMLHELWLAWKAGALKYAPSPAGVDGLNTDRNAAFKACPESGCDWGSFYLGWKARGEVEQAIIDGLRGEVAKLREALESKVPLYEAVQRACGSLPDGWKIEIHCEQGAGWVDLYDDCGVLCDGFPTDNERLDYTVNDAINAALSTANGEVE